MRSRYAQVALTYTRALGPRIGGAMLAVYLLVLASGFAGVSDPRPQSPKFTYPVQLREVILILGIVTCGALALMVTAHAKEQLADWRSRLVPRFRVPHVTVAGALIVICAVALPWLTARALREAAYGATGPVSDVSVLGTIALTAVVVAMSAWLANLQSLPFLALFFAMFMPLATTRGVRFVGWILSADSPAAAWAMITAAAVAVAALLWRLAAMHEGMAEYARLDVSHRRLRPVMTGDARARRESAAESGRINEFLRGTSALERPWPAHAAGFWRRAWYWRAGLGMGHVYALVGALLALWAIALPHIAREVKTEGTTFMVVAPQVMGLMLPIVLSAHAWARRWHVLGLESLRPAARRQFILEQGAALALDLALAWAMIMLGALLPTLIFFPGNLRSGGMWFSLFTMACGQVLLFGVNVWVLRWRSGWLSLVTLAATAATQAVLLPTVVIPVARRFPLPGVGLIALLVLLGVAVTYDAYRRWLATELD